MDILILGGTEFVGRHITNHAIQKGHNVSLLNRCNNTDIFPQLKRHCVDRNDTLDIKLDIDCIIDISGYYRYQVKNILDNISTRYYIFISSVAVDWDDDMMYDYKHGKIGCEIEIINKVKKSLIFRPTYICGKYDNTNRFDYSKWPDVYWIGTNDKVNYVNVSQFSYNVIDNMERGIEGIIY